MNDEMSILEQIAEVLQAADVDGQAVEIMGGGWDVEEWQGVLVVQTTLAEWHIEPPDWRCPTWTASRYPGCGWHGSTGAFSIEVAEEDDPISIAAGVRALIDQIEGDRA
jgi:hypothetical protein